MHVPSRGHVSASVLCSVLLLPALLSGFQAPPAAARPETGITKAEVEKHIRFLASDELMGRKAGTPGDHVTERYIAEHFRASGLSPAPGFQDFLQPVPLIRRHSPERQLLRLAGSRLQPGKDFLVLQGESFQFDGDVKDLSDTPGEVAADGELDLRGKVAISRLTHPDGSVLQSYREKAESARKRGARAILDLYSGPESPTWDRVRRFLASPGLRLEEAETARRIPYFLVNDPEGSLAHKLEAPGKQTARISLSERRVERVISANVVGVLQGQDPILKEEFVGLTAHFDHLGQNEKLPHATEEDSIFNGARDNGMGVSALLAAATVLSRNPPARSLIFVAFTAEEQGLLGSSYYARNPAVPLEKTVFVLNNDGAGYNDTSAVTVLGLDRTTAAQQIEEGCRDFGLEAISGGRDLDRFFNASDNVSFAEKGVPAPTFSPGMRTFGEEILQYYHRPSDEADENFDFDYLHRFCQAFTRSVQLIADHPTRPAWVAGDRFEKAAERLYGGNQ